MCLIIHNPKGKQVPLDIIDNAFYMNPDGFGIFYHDTGEIHHTMSPIKGEDLLDADRPFTAHFRYATSGPIGKKQCHPFQIDGTYSLMMNGTIDRLVSRKTVDTVELCKILHGLPESKMLAVLRTYACRFALLNRKTGKAIIVNRDLWSERDGVLYSKANCFPSKPTGKMTEYGKGITYGKAYTPVPTGNANVKSIRLDAEDPDTWDDDSWNEWVDSLQQDSEEHEAVYTYDDEPEEDAPFNTDPPQLHTVAVYGTLKSGRNNHGLLADSYCLGAGMTELKFPMIQSGIPFLIDDAKNGHHITVEAYRVDNATLRRLDGLEGHPGWYVRRKLSIKLDKGGYITAWVYTIPKDECHSLTGMDYLKEKHLSCF